MTRHRANQFLRSGRWWAGAAALSALAIANFAAERITLEDAVRSTLKRDPNIQIQEQQTRAAEGAVIRESGRFDVGIDSTLSHGIQRTPRTLADRLSLSSNIVDTVADVTSQTVSANKQTRYGPSASIGGEVNRIDDNFNSAISRGAVTFAINVPLTKLGKDYNAAFERAAKIQRDAATLDLAFVTGQRILVTAGAFWDCLGAEENLKTLSDSADRAKSLLERVKQLVAGKEIPGAELRQTEADLSGKLAQLRAGEQRFMEAKQTLGLALGLENRELPNVPLPQADWPTVATNQNLPSFTGDVVVQRSLNRRADFQSARKQEDAAAVLTRAARIDLRPNLDLTVQTSYAGLSEGGQFRRFYSSLDPLSVNGPSAVGALRFSYPIGNHAAKGTLIEREAAQKQAELRQQNLARNIGSSIMVAFSELEHSSQEVLQAREAVTLYRQTVANEREKLRIGNSTIIDVITLEDRLDTAEIRATEALVRYATALTRIRFETGILPTMRAQSGTISVEALRTPPPQTELESTENFQPR